MAGVARQLTWGNGPLPSLVDAVQEHRRGRRRSSQGSTPSGGRRQAPAGWCRSWLGYAAAGGSRRNFASVPGIAAGAYDVLVEGPVADEAVRLLEGATTRPATAAR